MSQFEPRLCNVDAQGIFEIFAAEAIDLRRGGGGHRRSSHTQDNE